MYLFLRIFCTCNPPTKITCSNTTTMTAACQFGRQFRPQELSQPKAYYISMCRVNCVCENVLLLLTYSLALQTSARWGGTLSHDRPPLVRAIQAPPCFHLTLLPISAGPVPSYITMKRANLTLDDKMPDRSSNLSHQSFDLNHPHNNDKLIRPTNQAFFPI